MHIIIVGGGGVSYELARNLSEKNQDVVVIEKNAEKALRFKEALDVMVIEDNGANAAILEQAGVKKADMVVAVTQFDEVNVIACMIAKQYDVPITVCRIRNQQYVGASSVLTPQQLGIDVVINPEKVAAMEISRDPVGVHGCSLCRDLQHRGGQPLRLCHPAAGAKGRPDLCRRGDGHLSRCPSCSPAGFFCNRQFAVPRGGGGRVSPAGGPRLGNGSAPGRSSESAAHLEAVHPSPVISLTLFNPHASILPIIGLGRDHDGSVWIRGAEVL